MPNMKKLKMDRCNNIVDIQIWAPRIEELGFENAFALNSLKILDKIPREYEGVEGYGFSGTMSRFVVDVYHGGLS